MIEMPNVASRVFDAPLMIAPQKLRAILAYLGPRLGFEGFESHLGALPKGGAVDTMPRVRGDMYDDDDDREEREQRKSHLYPILPGGVALIPVVGTLVHRGAWVGASSGLTSYQYLSNAIIDAMNNPAVRRILYDIDSFGGECAGCFDLVDMVYSMRGEKPMTAMVNESCYSAGYAFASAADKIILTRTGGVGSIGVIATHVDQSEHNEKEGYKVHHIFAGAHKADFSPHQPVTDEALEWLRARVFESYDIFTDIAARNRGMTVEAVKKTEAGIFIGRAGIAHGLADEIATAMEVMQREIQESKRSNSMTTKIKPEQAEGVFTAINAAAKDAGITETEVQADPAGAVQKSIKAAVETATKPHAAVYGALSSSAKEKEVSIDAAAVQSNPAAFVAAVHDAGVKKGAENAATAHTQRLKDIKALARQANRPEMAIDLVIEGLSVEECRAKLLGVLSTQERIESGLDPANQLGNTQPVINTQAIYEKRKGGNKS